MAKRTTRKATSKASKRNARQPVMKFSDKAKIVAVAKDNPRREGSGPHKRFAVIQRYKGKPVASYVAGKGRLDTLRRAVREGHAKVA